MELVIEITCIIVGLVAAAMIGFVIGSNKTTEEFSDCVWHVLHHSGYNRSFIIDFMNRIEKHINKTKDEKRLKKVHRTHSDAHGT